MAKFMVVYPLEISKSLASKVIEFMTERGYRIATGDNEMNIVYIEGMGVNFQKNSDEPNKWNDLSIIIKFVKGTPYLYYLAKCTTEPGLGATISKAARLLGGVARIAFGQHLSCWRVGLHHPTRNPSHPALVQCGPVKVHRDYNRDMKRTNDPISLARGLNQHGTWPGYRGENVDHNSAGCLVRQVWDDHLAFIETIKSDWRYQQNNRFAFDTTIINGDEFDAWLRKDGKIIAIPQ